MGLLYLYLENLNFSRNLLHGFNQNLVEEGGGREGERKKLFYSMTLSISRIYS